MDERTSFAFDRIWRARTDRRAFLLGSLALVGAGALTRIQARPRWSASPFTLGVASGDPTHDGVVLWTRLAPEPLNGGGMPPEPVEVRWEVAADDAMRQIVQHGTRDGHRRLGALGPRRGRTASSPIAGTGIAFTPGERDEPDRPHAHAAARRVTTPIGCGSRSPRARTTSTGLFTAYRHMAAEDLDLVFHLGDYIYEGRRSRRPGAQARRPRARRRCRTTATATRSTRSIRICRPRTRRFRGSSRWDDHEVDNNYANDDLGARRSARRVPAPPRRRLPGLLRAHAAPPAIDAARARRMQLYRQFNFGTLASFFVLDTRQYRTDQPCGDGTKAPCAGVARSASDAAGRRAGALALRRARAARSAQWNVLPQQVMMARVDQHAGRERTLLDGPVAGLRRRAGRGCSSSSPRGVRPIRSC